VIESTLAKVPVLEPTALSVVESADAEARQLAAEYIAGLPGQGGITGQS